MYQARIAHKYVHTPGYVYVHMYILLGMCTYGTSHKKLDDERWSNCVRTVTDRALTAVRTAYVRVLFVLTRFFSLSDAFAIGLWLLSLHFETKFVTFRS